MARGVVSYPVATWRAPKWKAALARAAGGGSPAKILVHGHSHIVGEGSGTSTLGLVNCVPTGWAGLLAASLSSGGLLASRYSFFGDQNAPAGGFQLKDVDPRMVQGGGWVSDNSPVTFGGRFLVQPASNSGLLDFTPGFSFTSARVWYPVASGLSTSLGVYADGVSKTSINEAGSNALAHVDISVPASASKLSFLNNGAAQGNVLGAECFAPGQNVLISQVGWCGALSADLASQSNPWSPASVLPALSPDLYLMEIMTNDVNSGTSAATWQANVNTLLAAASASADVILVIDPVCSGANFTSGLYDQYISAAMTLIASYGGHIIDLRNALGSTYAGALANGWMFDGNHPSAVGHQLCSAEVAKQILLAR